MFDKWQGIKYVFCTVVLLCSLLETPPRRLLGTEGGCCSLSLRRWKELTGGGGCGPSTCSSFQGRWLWDCLCCSQLWPAQRSSCCYRKHWKKCYRMKSLERLNVSDLLSSHVPQTQHLGMQPIPRQILKASSQKPSNTSRQKNIFWLCREDKQCQTLLFIFETREAGNFSWISVTLQGGKVIKT